MATATRQTQEYSGADTAHRRGESTATDKSTSKTKRRTVEQPRINTSEQENESVESGATVESIQRSHADITLSFKMTVNLDPSKRYPTNV